MSMILKNFTRNLLRGDRILKSALGSVDHAVCIDIECTCDSPVQIYPMEIIEIACQKVDLTSVNTSESKITTKGSPIFHTFVKPVINPELTLFCRELTGITQSTLENADTADKMVVNLMKWLKDEGLVNDTNERSENFAFASCGNFDMKMLAPVVKHCLSNNNLELPIYFQEWINVKKTFVNHKKRWPKGLYHMVELLGHEPCGRLHSAMDDCRNLAKVLECLHHQGGKFSITNKLVDSG